uniref:Putative secreted protein n=1 Tax=Ixodes ricinus TaxID=34613 RepID=A0A147BV85_IXORI
MTLMSLRSTLVSLVGSTTRSTASTAMGASWPACWDTTLDDRAVVALFSRESRSERSRGCAMDSNTSTAIEAARWNDSEMIVGWMPLRSNLAAASSRLPQITTTEVVPSPASTSCALDSSTSILAAGCSTCICFRMVAPSLVMVTSPLAAWIILSIPRGPRLVRMASATALAAVMLLWRTWDGLSLSL